MNPLDHKIPTEGQLIKLTFIYINYVVTAAFIQFSF